MKKPDEIRAVLAKAVPELDQNPDRLHVYAEKGVVMGSLSTATWFETRYTLVMLIQDLTSNPDIIFAALMDWIRENQPEILQNRERRENGLTFEVEVLNNASCDVLIQLPLTEIVRYGDDNG